MRNRHTTGMSKRGASEMMNEAAIDAARDLPEGRRKDMQSYLHALNATYLTQDQMHLIECLVDVAFEGGKARGAATVPASETVSRQAVCPFCGGKAGLADQADPTSDWGCPRCGAFIDTDGAWTEAFPPRPRK